MALAALTNQRQNLRSGSKEKTMWKKKKSRNKLSKKKKQENTRVLSCIAFLSELDLRVVLLPPPWVHVAFLTGKKMIGKQRQVEREESSKRNQNRKQQKKKESEQKKLQWLYVIIFFPS